MLSLPCPIAAPKPQAELEQFFRALIDAVIISSSLFAGFYVSAMRIAKRWKIAVVILTNSVQFHWRPPGQSERESVRRKDESGKTGSRQWGEMA